MLKALRRILFLTPVVVLLAVGMVNAQGHKWLDDPGQLGHYAVGHTCYQFVDQYNNGRPVAISVWYPADTRDIDSSTPPAEYLTDPYTGTQYLPSTYSGDWEKLGYDRAYEGLAPSHNGPFPLLMVSPAYTDNNWEYLFIGTRLASHGYVVAVTDHWGDGQWSWSQADDFLTVMLNRPRDVSFAMTQLLAKSRTPKELLFQSIDPERIATSGHSLGGYAAYALAGGDDGVCDALWPALEGADTLPYPADTCVPTRPDRRIKAMIAMDGSSQLFHYRELARISVPSLIIGDTVDQSETIYPDASLRDWIARPHAAIDRKDSYRVDVDGANHYSYANICDGFQVWFNLGWINSDTLTALETSWPCASTGWFPAAIPAADAHEVVTKYMISLLDLYLAGPDKSNWLDEWILTPEYALSHKPTVQFFDSEACHAVLPDHTYFTYRPYQTSSECDVAQKDPAGWFASPSPSASDDAATPMLLTPAPASAQNGPVRRLKRPDLPLTIPH